MSFFFFFFFLQAVLWFCSSVADEGHVRKSILKTIVIYAVLKLEITSFSWSMNYLLY